MHKGRITRSAAKPIYRVAGRLGAWCCLFALLLMPGIAPAQSLNPLESDPRAAGMGGSLYRAQCATCHGADARGIPSIQAPDLTRLWTQPGKTDGSVFQTIRNGIPGSIMPPHAFNDTQIWMLVSYLRSIGVDTAGDSYQGDIDRGANLFARTCQRCHRVDGQGGALGPDLSRITEVRSRQALQLAIRQPSTAMAQGYRPVRVVVGPDRQFRGLVKSEDAFSIQIMDTGQSLRGFRKADLLSLQYEERSLMPVFPQSALSDADLEDLLSYLAAGAGARNK